MKVIIYSKLTILAQIANLIALFANQPQIAIPAKQNTSFLLNKLACSVKITFPTVRPAQGVKPAHNA